MAITKNIMVGIGSIIVIAAILSGYLYFKSTSNKSSSAPINSSKTSNNTLAIHSPTNTSHSMNDTMTHNSMMEHNMTSNSMTHNSMNGTMTHNVMMEHNMTSNSMTHNAMMVHNSINQTAGH